MTENRDRASYTEVKTDDLGQIEAFIRQQADGLENRQITISKRGSMFIADCFAEESAT